MDPVAMFSRGNATSASPRAKRKQLNKSGGSKALLARKGSEKQGPNNNPFVESSGTTTSTTSTETTLGSSSPKGGGKKGSIVKLKGLVWKKPRNQKQHPLARPNVALKFQLRFMELDDRGMLRYYMNANDVAKGPDPRHQIDVTGCTVVPIGTDGKLYTYELYAKNGDKVVLGQESPAEAKAWIDCLKELADHEGDRRNTAMAQELLHDAAAAAAAAAEAGTAAATSELEGDGGEGSSRSRALTRSGRPGSRGNSRSKSRDPKERGLKPTLNRKKSVQGQALANALDTPPQGGGKAVGSPSAGDDGEDEAFSLPPRPLERKRSKLKNIFGSSSSLDAMTDEDDRRAESSKKLAEAIAKERAASKRNAARRSIVMLLVSVGPVAQPTTVTIYPPTF